MNKSYYIVFERCPDPPREKPMMVCLTRVEAEAEQLRFQQDRATSHNISRNEAFAEGRSFGSEAHANDFVDRFFIEKVKS